MIFGELIDRRAVRFDTLRTVAQRVARYLQIALTRRLPRSYQFLESR